MIAIAVKKVTYSEVEVFLNEFSGSGVSRGVWDLPGRLIEDIDHLGAKSSGGVGPVDARRKGRLGYALSLPLALVDLFPLALRTPYKLLGSS